MTLKRIMEFLRPPPVPEHVERAIEDFATSAERDGQAVQHKLANLAHEAEPFRALVHATRSARFRRQVRRENGAH